MTEESANTPAAESAAADTIAAISTPPGRGGIGIVRLSGPQAASIAAQLVRLHQPLEHARARLADVLDEQSPEAAATAESGAEGSGKGGNPADSEAQSSSAKIDEARIDEALVTYFAAPHSYTADDLVEIAAHG